MAEEQKMMIHAGEIHVPQRMLDTYGADFLRAINGSPQAEIFVTGG